MKQKIYIFGLVTILIIITGLVFKVNHLAGAGKLLTGGIGILVILFLPLALKNNYTAEGDRQKLPLYLVTWLTCFLVFTAMLFKIMHWPFTALLVLVAIPLPYIVFLPVFLYVTAKDSNFSIYNTVFVLLLLVTSSVFTALLALNVSKNRIDDSYNLSRDYNRIESVLRRLDAGSDGNKVVQNINDVLKTVKEYKEIILKQEDLSLDQWKEDPRGLNRSEIKGIAAQALLNSGDRPAGGRLYEGLQNLIKNMQAIPGNEGLAEQAPMIFDMVSPTGNQADWYSWKFNDNNLAWVLIYLDGLEINLKLIRASLNTGQ